MTESAARRLPRPANHAGVRLPLWVGRRRHPRSQSVTAAAVSARPVASGARWWIGVIWLVASALLLGFVAHVTVLGALQHARGQQIAYQQLRSDLAQAITPLGQLDLNEKPVVAGTPIAFIQIPRLGLSEVIAEGTAGEQLRLGPGHRRDTVMPGQLGTSVLQGRQATYGGAFASLGRLEPGDTITVTTGQGVNAFEVFGIRRSGDPLPAALDAKGGRLELVTADGFALAPSGTLHIDATLTSATQETPARVFTTAVLDDAENAMQSDSGAWFPTLFWLQWLIAGAVVVRWLLVRWGTAQAWIVGVPIMLALGAATADSAIAMLPNLL